LTIFGLNWREIDKQLPQEGACRQSAHLQVLLIILGDGREDEVFVVPLICHHLNGNKTAAILKPDVYSDTELWTNSKNNSLTKL
jgi:hypothetical protein